MELPEDTNQQVQQTEPKPYRRGRRPKINIKKFKLALENSGGNVTLISKKLDVSRNAIYEFINNNPETKELLEQEREKIVDMAEGILSQKVAEGDMAAVRLVLTTSTRGRKRGYGDVLELSGTIETTFKDKLDQDYELLKTLSKSTREELLKKLHGK